MQKREGKSFFQKIKMSGPVLPNIESRARAYKINFNVSLK